MMPKLYKSVTVSGVANEEALETLITSTTVERKHITAVYLCETTSPRNGDAFIRFYVEREKIGEVPISLYQSDLNNKMYMVVPKVILDIDLPEGQSLIVGVVSGTTASDFVFTVEYELT